LNNELDKVLSKLFVKLDKLEDEKFEDYKEALNKKLTKPFSNLKEKSDAAWREIYEDSLDFEIRKSLIRQLPKLKSKDLLEFFGRNFVGQPKKLSIRIFNKGEAETDNEENYGYLNSKLKTSIYYKTDFLSATKIVTKRISK
jgi:secreted Zn-dependent insulinase-like peptidase